MSVDYVAIIGNMVFWWRGSVILVGRLSAAKAKGAA